MFIRKQANRWLMMIILSVLLCDPSVWADMIFMEQHLVVKMNDGFSVEMINEQFGTWTIQHLEQLDIYLLNDTSGTDLWTLSLTIDSLQEVEFCHPNYIVVPLQAVQTSIPISDILGQGDCATQPAAQTLELADVHAITTGTDARVALLDGGVNFAHPHLDGSVVSGYDYVDNDDDAFDEVGGINSGHGTFIAGIIHLVAPGAEIVSYRVTDLDGFSTGYIVSEAILRALDDGCRVINLSMVMSMEHKALHQAIEYAKAHDVVVVAAAGNDQFDFEKYPAVDDNVIAVAAVDSFNILADFSCYGSHIDVCAPGTEIYSAYLDTGYAWWGGTSFAAPFVTGQVALLVSSDSTLTYGRIVPLIRYTALSIDSINPGYEGMLGTGLISIGASLQFIDCICGDLNYDGQITLADAIELADILFSANKDQSESLFGADVDPFEGVDVGDMTYLLGFLYQAGELPCLGESNGVQIPGGEVTVDHVSGLVGPAEIIYNQSLRLFIKFRNNTGDVFSSLSSGFKVYSPEGAALVVGEFQVDDNIASSFIITSPPPAAGYDPEAFGWYGYTLSVHGLPAGYDDVIFTITLDSLTEGDIGKTVCLDTSSYGNGGTWKWQIDGLSNHHPLWEGPYCYTIVNPDFIPGDVNDDDRVDVTDITHMVDYLFLGLISSLDNYYASDMDGNCSFGNIADLLYLIDYLFQGGQPPVYGCTGG